VTSIDAGLRSRSHTSHASGMRRNTGRLDGRQSSLKIGPQAGKRSHGHHCRPEERKQEEDKSAEKRWRKRCRRAARSKGTRLTFKCQTRCRFSDSREIRTRLSLSFSPKKRIRKMRRVKFYAQCLMATENICIYVGI